ncbi:amino acid adenylation domain-containing protein [Actinacidiphila yanglinensis]|uniref:Amino acid adenylation domain-containing protein n=1 Tax=Actinacidiphila yanglinensis TaxID=310779 RepID=A0A1H6DHT7_9ACTN|nr:non-ribosomal peptide synthetase [Actinacidiphila yanglinensis]SEG84383.1 amino acid adenylation domain-containing protein [Actinacidiphila yanglinensis]
MTLTTEPIPPRATEPAELLATLAAVLHRRTLQEHIRITVHRNGGRHLFDADLSDDPDLATLAGRGVEIPVESDDCEPDAVLLLGTPEPGAPAAVPVFFLHAGTLYCAVPPNRPPGLAGELLDQVRTARADARAHPGRAVSGLRLASAAELRRIETWSGSGAAPAAARPIHLLVEDQVRRAPEATALRCGGTVLTYSGLNRHADRLATQLAEAGAGPGQVVAVLAERSPELVVALLAVLKTGAAYAAFEPDLPASRLRQQLADTGANVVLAQPGLRTRPPEGAVLLTLEAPAGSAGEQDIAGGVDLPNRVSCEVHPDELAYVSFTSGSTGVPKGACVSHRAVSRLVQRPDWADFGPGDVFLQLAPVAFDASTLEIWGALTNGAALAIHPAGPISTSRLAGTLVDEKITVAWFTAGLFDRMVRGHLDAFTGLRHVLAGGDVVPAHRVQSLLKSHPGLVFSNGYGPTENTTFTTVWTSTLPPGNASVPVGRPISGTLVRVLDPLLRPVPVGVPGELHAGGEGLARCYLGRAADTADRFGPDPLGGFPGARLYRTGDLVRWLPDGSLEFLGRADRQIKVQGYRVEPGEVEAVLSRHPDVRQAVVTTQDDGSRGKRLLAYITALSPEDDDPAELGRRLREELRSELPAYMVPSAVLSLAELPLNRNGKVDRSALPAARRLPRNLHSEYQAPRSALEAVVAEEWGDLLGIEPVGVEDDFFELGGHSLLAAELLSRLQQRFAVTVPARTLYLHPTVAELTETLPALADNPVRT